LLPSARTAVDQVAGAVWRLNPVATCHNRLRVCRRFERVAVMKLVGPRLLTCVHHIITRLLRC